MSMPVISKDDIKEFLYDKLGAADASAAKMLGIISFDVVYSIIENYLDRGKSVIIDCPFFVVFAKDRVAAMLAVHPEGRIFELHCELSELVRNERFNNRIDTAERHVVHRTGDTSLPKPQTELEAIYAPLEVGPVIRVNTNHFGITEYEQLLEKLNATIGEK